VVGKGVGQSSDQVMPQRRDGSPSAASRSRAQVRTAKSAHENGGGRLLVVSRENLTIWQKAGGPIP